MEKLIKMKSKIGENIFLKVKKQVGNFTRDFHLYEKEEMAVK